MDYKLPGETEVLVVICEVLTNREISERLCICKYTVKQKTTKKGRAEFGSTFKISKCNSTYRREPRQYGVAAISGSD